MRASAKNASFRLSRSTHPQQPGTAAIMRSLLLACLIYSIVWPLLTAVRLGSPPAEIAGRLHCIGKEPLLKKISDAGISDPNCTSLPLWNQITRLYGNEPVIVGLDTCTAYRRSVADGGGAVPRIAGMYNTGTNALAKLFELNWKNHTFAYDLEGSYFKWDVPYGKHVPYHKKDNVTVPGGNPTPKDLVLPIVLIKDPLWWMQSMCRNPYGAKWSHHDDHCPNLVVNEVDQERFGHRPLHASIAVTTKYTFGTPRKNNIQKFQLHYASLVHLWNDYYREYLDSTSPRLMIRYEDMLYHAPTVFQAISACVGIDMDQFHYVTVKSKTHGSGETDFIRALAKYGNDDARIAPLTTIDRLFARQMLDQRLMQTFQYNYPEE